MAIPSSELARAVGQRLRDCRLRPDRMWSQEYCWTFCGLSRRQWQRLENGTCLAQPRTWAAIKTLFTELSTPAP